MLLLLLRRRKTVREKEKGERRRRAASEERTSGSVTGAREWTVGSKEKGGRTAGLSDGLGAEGAANMGDGAAEDAWLAADASGALLDAGADAAGDGADRPGGAPLGDDTVGEAAAFAAAAAAA